MCVLYVMDIAPTDAPLAPANTGPAATSPPPLSPSPSATIGLSGAPAIPEPSRPATRWVELAALASACVLGDVALFGGTGGVGLGVCLVGAPLLVLVGRGAPAWSWRLVGVGALIVALAARAAWQASLWTAIVGVGLLFAFAVTATRRDGYLPELAVSSVGSMVQAFVTMRDWARDGARRVTRGRTVRLPWVTVVVPVVVVGVFALVLVAANPVLERWATTAGDAISDGALLPSPLRVVLWAVCAWLAAAWLRPFHAELFVARTGDLHRLDEANATAAGPYRVAPENESRTGSVALATSRNVLVGVNVLFALCVALDAVHLWAGRVPDGMIHTDYAHRGAAWLTVALVLCTVVLSAIFRGAQNFGSGSKTLRILAFAWIAQSLVLAAGTLRRIQLYVDDSGLTNLRIVGFV
ncbi:MAG: DUF4173 domain-containing protein, partial [Deltaproteobacteria bacterium]|nr:DUF4173 domain-containing protein [Deltaproteobacteria bacterium]